MLAVTTRRGRELAATSRGVSLRAEVPPAASGTAYAGSIEQLVHRERIDLVIPTSDEALIALGRPEARFVDKRRLAEAARAHGIEMPRSLSATSVREIDSRAVEYPIVVKPRSGAGLAVRVERPRDLAALPDAGPVLVQPFVDDEMTAIAGLVWQGSLRAVVHQRYLRRWPVECGPACAAITTEPDLEREKDLLRLLDGFDGIFQAQYIGRGLIDLNPRPYGSMSLATAAGVNLPALLCALHQDPEAPTASRDVLRARPGVRYRWLEGDLRHALHQRKHRARPLGQLGGALLPRRGTAHSVFSARDPGPALARIRQILTALTFGSW